MKDNILLRWLPALVWALFIFSTSASSNPYRSLPESVALPIAPTRLDQGSTRISTQDLLSPLSHVGEYLVLAVLTTRALNRQRELHFGRQVLGFAICTLYATSDEIHQLFIAGRAFEWQDLAFDLAGSLIGVVLYRLIFTSVAY